MTRKTHFFITAINSHRHWATSTRCWGYTDTLEQAREAVRTNYYDLHEGTYDYIVIEEHIMNAYAIATEFIEWWKWNENTHEYELTTEVPLFGQYITNWGIG